MASFLCKLACQMCISGVNWYQAKFKWLHWSESTEINTISGAELDIMMLRGFISYWGLALIGWCSDEFRLFSFFFVNLTGVSQHLLQLRGSVASRKRSLAAGLSRKHSMMRGVISLQFKENIITQKTSVPGPEKHSSLFIHPVWSKESNTQLWYCLGTLLPLVSCLDSRCLTVFWGVWLSLCAHCCAERSILHMCCVRGRREA